MSVLQSWFEELYPTKENVKNLVIIIQDFEGFKHDVLQDFLLIVRYI